MYDLQDADFLRSLAVAAQESAKTGGVQLLEWRGKFEAKLKGPSDFVTDADLASQLAIETELRRRFPDHAFLGEETPVEEARQADDNLICWVVDPLDGTTNYLHDMPLYAVSVAAVLDGQVLAGAIYDPNTDELFWAAKGQGAWLHQAGEARALRTSDAATLPDSLLAMSLPAAVHSDSPDLLDFLRIAPHCQAVRRIGSAALNLAYVAAGRLDGHWAREINAWDVAAGVLLVTEAGGIVTDDTGQPFDLWHPRFVACCTSGLHGELVSALSSPRQQGS